MDLGLLPRSIGTKRVLIKTGLWRNDPYVFTFLLFSEYQTDSQPLRPCELQREKAFSGGETYVPQCSEDGQFR